MPLVQQTIKNIIAGISQQPSRLRHAEQLEEQIIKEVAECNELTNQRVSALLRQLKDEGKVVKTVDKRKSYFQLVG